MFQCSVCNTHTDNIDSFSTINIFPVCIPCINGLVEEKAANQPEMVVSTSRIVNDQTPPQLKPDSRCKYCAESTPHSQWAHEDAVEAYFVEEDKTKALKLKLDGEVEWYTDTVDRLGHQRISDV